MPPVVSGFDRTISLGIAAVPSSAAIRAIGRSRKNPTANKEISDRFFISCLLSLS
jgi:hypothetical protein